MTLYIAAAIIYGIAWTAGFISGRVYEMKEQVAESESEKAVSTADLYPPKQ
jgi:hypothetical protein